MVRIEFTDLPALKKHWWLVNEDDEVDLCVKDPGYEVDLVVAGRLRALVAVWMGDSSMSAVIRARELLVEGPRDLVRALPGWLRRSIFASVERPQIAPTPA